MELTFEWPSAIISLESLPPFSPEQLDTELITSDIDRFSRSESADKLFDHFNVPQQEESEPFDWFSNEKPVDIPFFECPPSPPFAYKADPFPYRADDVKPPAAPTYAVAARHYDATSHYDAAGYAAPAPHYPSTSPANLYDAIAPSTPYSPPAEQPQSPPQPPAASHLYGCAAAHAVKVECCDPSVGSPAEPFTAEWLKRETLTPPDSPRDEEILKMLEEMEPEALERLMLAPSGQPLALADELSCGSPSVCSDDGASSSGASSSGASSSGASPYAASEGGADDADWMPAAQSAPGAAATRRRAGKPYSKPGVEERRLRKKEQNKNAATRYRLKKKAEVEEVKLEEHQLLEQNVELRKQLEEVCREVRYLKSLMREAYRKQGLIK